jgi:hypothetical protein
MLILTHGDVNLARTSLEELQRNSEDLARFASSVPIHQCRCILLVMSMVQSFRFTRPPFQIGFARGGDLLYSFTNEDQRQYGLVNHCGLEFVSHPVTSTEFFGSEEAVRFFRSQWTENEELESVFIMEGLSEVGARNLMKMARGRYVMAWTHFKSLYDSGWLSMFEQGRLFSEMEDRDQMGRRVQLLNIAMNFVGTLLIADPDRNVQVLVAPQDAREFFQRNPYVLH